MRAAEFQTKIIDGTIPIPKRLRDQFQGEVSVILFASGVDTEPSCWPDQNRRRWYLIAKMARQQLTPGEVEELATLQKRADEQLNHLGPRPLEELERWYAELSQEA